MVKSNNFFLIFWKRVKYSFKYRKRKIERFISKLSLNTKLQVKSYLKNHFSWSVIKEPLWYLLNAGFTGMLLFYSFTHFNWISVAILVASTQYYIEWFVNLIKQN